MAAGLGFKTFTTGEVLTAADTNGYLMQGINVFASTAARDAAITSPQEGQFAYTKDTNSLWYYTGSAWAASGATGDIEGVTAGVGITGGGTSGTVTITNDMATTITAAGDIVVGTGSGTYDNLPIGTTAQVLTADTTVSPYKVKWATPAAATGDFVLINTTSFSAVSSQSVNNVFSATYDNYLIKLNETYPVSGGPYINLRLRVSGTDATSGYRKQNLQVDGTATYALRTTTDTAFNNIAYLGAGYNDSAEFNLQNPFNSLNTTANGIWATGSGAGVEVNLSAWGINNGTSYTGFTIIASTGTITGSVSVYGYKK
jgi:hypothetical protein